MIAKPRRLPKEQTETRSATIPANKTINMCQRKPTAHQIEIVPVIATSVVSNRRPSLIKAAISRQSGVSRDKYAGINAARPATADIA